MGSLEQRIHQLVEEGKLNREEAQTLQKVKKLVIEMAITRLQKLLSSNLNPEKLS